MTTTFKCGSYSFKLLFRVCNAEIMMVDNVNQSTFCHLTAVNETDGCQQFTPHGKIRMQRHTIVQQFW